LLIGFQDTVENVWDVFLGHGVEIFRVKLDRLALSNA